MEKSTTLDVELDDALVAKAITLSGIADPSALVNAALKALIDRAGMTDSVLLGDGGDALS